jgi:archaellum biogenesis ATPase FlaH
MAVMETLLGAVLKDRLVYEQFERHGDVDSITGLGKHLYRACDEYYRTDPSVQSCDRSIITERVVRTLPNPKHETAFRQFVASIPEECSVSNVARDIRDLKLERVSGELSLALANRGTQDNIKRLIQEYTSASDGHPDLAPDTKSELIDILDTTDLTQEVATYDYIKLWPKQLNDRLDGGAVRGHHVLVYARPETGKTLFAINLCAGFLHQRLNVLYVGNEEPGQDIRDRLRGRLLKLSKSQVRSDRKASAERLAKADIGSVLITEGTTFAGVRSALEGRKIDVVILDQIRNMRLKSDSRTSELEQAGIEARAIAKECGVLVVSITQAGDSASGKVYLDMSDIDSSKTGLPASADLLVGIGADEAMKVNGLLGISLPKNKLSGIHDKFTVSVNFSTGEVF